eukprot:415398-Prymnesium_polylepis.1
MIPTKFHVERFQAPHEKTVPPSGRMVPARYVSSSDTWYTKASFCDETSQGTLPCSSAAEVSAELLETHSRPPAA